MILYSAEEIRRKIQLVLNSNNGQRCAIVAFVGQDVLDFIQEPAGLTVYCWPNVAATHPDGINNLLSKGAVVFFVDRLHVKLFWSADGGAVLGSCNLTRNALGGGDAGLYELAYYTKNSSEIAIDALIKKFRAKRKKVTPTILAAYRRKYNAAAARRDEYVTTQRRNKNVNPLSSFGEYLKQPRRKWSITFWGTHAKGHPRGVLDAVAAYEKKEGLSKAPDRYIAGSVECDHKPQIGEWVLSCKVGSNYGLLSWTYTHIAAKPRKSGTVWCAIEVKKQTEQPPFDCKEKRLVDACHAFLNEIDSATSFVMTEAKLARLARHHREIPERDRPVVSFET